MLGRVVVASLTLALLAATVNATPVDAVGRSEIYPPAYLFAFDGRDAELRKAGGARQQFELIMPVRGPSHLVTWFTERPERNAGHITMNEFVSLWTRDSDGGFGTDPPNVALTFGQKSMIATMTKPRITRTPDGTKVLMARLTPLQEVDLVGLDAAQGTVGTKAKRGSSPPKASRIFLPSLSVFVDAYECVETGLGVTYTEWDNLCGTPKGQV